MGSLGGEQRELVSTLNLSKLHDFSRPLFARLLLNSTRIAVTTSKIYSILVRYYLLISRALL